MTTITKLRDKMLQLDIEQPSKTSRKTFNLKNRLFLPIPAEFRAEFAEMALRENAFRLLVGFLIGGLTHFGSHWVDFQRWNQGLFDQNPSFRWICYNHLVWWLVAWIPFEFYRKWPKIRAGAYPQKRLRALVGIGIVWAWAFPLMVAMLNFQNNHALGYYAIVLFVICIFILSLKIQFMMLLISALMMSIVIGLTPNLTNLEKQFWIISTVNMTGLLMMLSAVWHNKIIQQFLAGKSLDVQKRQLAEQAELLAIKNQIIEEDKKLLAEQLDLANNQLNNFALRLAKKGSFLDELKSELTNLPLPGPGSEVVQKKNRLLEKIKLEMDGESDWEHLRAQFERVNPRFFSSILERYPTLTMNELRLMTLLKMNLDTQEIAAILHISPQSLNTARYRLRKHLSLAPEDDLHQFVRQFG